MSAVFSLCGQYRYSLEREWSGDLFGDSRSQKANVFPTFVMLNPSTADHTTDDQTIRKCKFFTKAWGYNALRVVNMFGLRATDPAEIVKHPEPIGPDNDRYVALAAQSAPFIVCAWGNGAPRERVIAVVKILRATGATLMCLGHNESGSPKHPCYLAHDTNLVLWEPQL